MSITRETRVPRKREGRMDPGVIDGPVGDRGKIRRVNVTSVARKIDPVIAGDRVGTESPQIGRGNRKDRPRRI
jgi:hypothetical protein